MKTRLFIILAATLTVTMAAVAGAQEGDIGGDAGEQGEGQLDATVRDENDDGGGDTSGGDGGGSPWFGSSAAWIEYQCEPAGPWQPGYRVELAWELRYMAEDGIEYDLYAVICWRAPGDGYQWDPWPIPVDDPVADAIATRDRLLAELTVRVQAPTPEIATSPPVDGTHLVGLWAWFWVEPESYEPQSDTANDAGGLTIALTAIPGELRFFPGDDAVTGIAAVVTCEGPGLAWERGMEDTDTECRHFWDWPSKHDPSGQFTTRAEADYEFTWTATGALAAFLPATTGTLGTTTVTSPDTPVTVTEVQAVLG